MNIALLGWITFLCLNISIPTLGMDTSVKQNTVPEPVNWDGFRGQKQGISSWNNAPTSWDVKSGKGVLWKTPLKMRGASSPVVFGKQVYLSEADDNERAVLAFDIATGKQLWRHVVVDGGKGSELPTATGDTGFAAPTQVCDADGVYTLFGTGDLAAFTPDGKPKWQIFLKRPENMYGHASSPCLINGKIYIQYDQTTNARVLAINASDGKIIWETPRERGPSWSSPMIVPGANGKPLFVVNAIGVITAYDLVSGKEAWNVEGVTGDLAPSLTYADGCIYAVNEGSKLVCYKIGEKPEKRWEYTDNLAEISTPVVVNGLLFMASGKEKLVCLDAVIGKENWVQQGIPCFASLVASGPRVYAFGREGKVMIFDAKPVYNLIGACDMGGDAVDTTPAFGDGRMYIRSKENLWCVGEK